VLARASVISQLDCSVAFAVMLRVAFKLLVTHS